MALGTLVDSNVLLDVITEDECSRLVVERFGRRR